MNGFLISRTSVNESIIAEQGSVDTYSLGDYCYKVFHTNVQTLKSESSILIIDGYFFPFTIDEISQIITTKNFQQLNNIKGHYCGVLINANSMIFFNDSFGAKTIYWQQHNNELLVGSRAILMPVYDNSIDPLAKFETLLYRYTTSSHTLLTTTSKLKPRHTIEIEDEIIKEQISHWTLPAPKYSSLPLTEKVELTKLALINNLKIASQHYKKVAIFLSGGVDSSLLAALSKSIFDECCLITPVFKGEINPELETAKSFAKILDMPHYLVDVSHQDLLTDLEQLIKQNKEPLRHYSSLAMTVMMRAIPEDYQGVIYGEAADTLFGSNGIKRVETHLRWKKKITYIPNPVLSIFESLLPGRIKALKKVKKLSVLDNFLSLIKIPYSKKEQKVINSIQPKKTFEVDTWPSIDNEHASDTRYLAQSLFINCDMPIHFKEAELIAEQHNKHFISPFFDPEVMDISSTLSNSDFYGDDYVKPILRELACEYFPQELIYQKKYGFPVPFISWLKGPLLSVVEEAISAEYIFPAEQMKNLAIDDNYESYWLLINWHLTQKNFITCINNNDN